MEGRPKSYGFLGMWYYNERINIGGGTEIGATHRGQKIDWLRPSSFRRLLLASVVHCDLFICRL